ncbi:Transcription initiation factor IIA subunit 2 [Geodia barretti]|uniref:Transcription initiation factor IIA subunit 2 n=1 Tax=Geodia barretti TaxID=519541 RepID=A0AA35QVB6_GEOBA|nr:Transcription initiation factor IIA subunit 2 [Geodia barretti]
MSYQLYRSMSLGESLKAALDDLIENQLITPDLAVKQVQQQYDRSMSVALSTKVRTRYTFKGQLKVYRYCDNVWTCVLRNVEFKDSHNNEIINSEKVKIVACEANSSSK